MSQALQHILLHTGKKYLCSGIFVVGTAASVYQKQNADTFFQVKNLSQKSSNICRT